MKKAISLVLCVVMVLSLVVSASAISSVPVKSIKVDSASVALTVGGTHNIKVTFTPANTTQKLLKYATSNANVAKIDKNGKITAAGAGKAVITVASTVNAKAVAKITVTVTSKQAAGKRATLKVEVYDRGNAGGTPPDNNYWTKWIQANFGDKNNITVKFVSAPRFDNDAKLQMWMAAGTAPDLCYTYSVGVVDNFEKNGGLADLTAAFNTYGKDLKAFIGEDLVIKGQDTEKNNRQSNIVARRAITANENTWIRKDWLDALGLKIPTTTTEFYNDMKAFKEKNPGKVNVVPLTMTADVGWAAAPILESFRTDFSDSSRYITNGRYLLLFAPGVKDGVRFLNKMYNEGLMSKEFPLDTNNTTMQNADLLNGVGGAFIGNYDWPLREVPGILKNLTAKIPTAKLVPCDPFTDKNGKTTKKLYDPAGLRIFVPKTSEKNVDNAIKYLNWMADPDVISFLQLGEEGKNHKTVNGLPQSIPATGETLQNSALNIDYTMIVNGIIGKTEEDTIQRNSMSYAGESQSLFVQAYKAATKDGYFPPESRINTIPDADSKYGNSIVNKANEVYAKTITCKPSEFDTVWAQQTNALLQAGGSQMIAERRALWKKLHPAKK